MVASDIQPGLSLSHFSLCQNISVLLPLLLKLLGHVLTNKHGMGQVT